MILGDLTKNFSRAEFSCKCGCRYNNVSSKLASALQKLRDIVGKPIHINSSCRCPKHNKAVGGVKNSYHTQGIAADIRVDGLTPTQLAAYASKVGAFCNGGIGIYNKKNFVHVDVRGYKARWNGDVK